MFTLKISTANEAFDNDNEGLEIMRILREVAIEVASKSEGRGTEKTSGTIRDINGNTVGKWELK